MALTDKLTAIADGFRTSRGTEQKYTLDEMAVLAAEKVGGGGQPACVAMESAVNIAVYTEVTSRTYPQYYLYNGVRLPEFPLGVREQYPYAWIRENNSTGNYDLILSKTVNWYRIDSSSIRGDYDVLGTSSKWYTAPISNPTSWGEVEHNFGGFGIDTARTVLWSNHDIPNGSANATEIYFAGSAPVLDE